MDSLGRLSDEPSHWTVASPSLDELEWILRLAYEHLRNYGHEMTAADLRLALRRPV